MSVRLSCQYEGYYSPDYLFDQVALPKVDYQVSLNSSPMVQDSYFQIRKENRDSGVISPPRSSSIISSFVDYVRNEDMDSFSSGSSSSSSSGYSGQRNLYLNSSASSFYGSNTSLETPKQTLFVLKKRTGYFDGWDGTLIEEPEETLSDYDNTEPSLDQNMDSSYSSQGDDAGGPLIWDNFCLEDATPVEHKPVLPRRKPTREDSEIGFFTVLFSRDSNTSRKGRVSLKFSSPSDNQGSAPEKQYDTELRRYYEQRLTLAQKKAVSASFRDQVYRVAY